MQQNFHRRKISNQSNYGLLMLCTLAHKFRTRLEFKQYDVTLTKEQSVPTRIMSSFEGENMQGQYNVLGYKIDLYFHDNKLATEIDQNGK